MGRGPQVSGLGRGAELEFSPRKPWQECRVLRTWSICCGTLSGTGVLTPSNILVRMIAAHRSLSDFGRLLAATKTNWHCVLLCEARCKSIFLQSWRHEEPRH